MQRFSHVGPLCEDLCLGRSHSASNAPRPAPCAKVTLLAERTAGPWQGCRWAGAGLPRPSSAPHGLLPQARVFPASPSVAGLVFGVPVLRAVVSCLGVCFLEMGHYINM